MLPNYILPKSYLGTVHSQLSVNNVWECDLCKNISHSHMSHNLQYQIILTESSKRFNVWELLVQTS